MNRRTWKLVFVTLVAVCSLGALGAHARHPRAVVRGGPTPAHVETHAPSASAPAWDPLAEDRRVAQPPAASTDGVVSLQAQLDRRAVLLNADGVLQVKLTLQAPQPVNAAPRRPSDVLVVMDVSGSMAGQKIAYGRRALHELIDRLAPQDRFGLVSYESEARVVVPLQAAESAARSRFHRAVDGLEASGGTNMSEGLDLGLGALTGGHETRSARVLLLSDGHANQGDSSPAGLSDRARRIVRAEHVLTTMGIGDDFNEDLMAALAEVGAGNFYYLSRPEKIAHFFDAELRATSQTLASALELRFDPGDGAILEDISGYPVERAGDTYKIRPGNLYAGQTRTLWATVRIPTAQARKLDLGRFSVAYKLGDQPQLAAADALPQLECVSDAAQFEQRVERKVWEEAVLKNQLPKGRMALGKAISGGTAADVDREVQHYEQNADLARKLGASTVLSSIDQLKAEATQAKTAQSAPAASRNITAKRAKASSLYDLRKDSYNTDALSGM